MAKANELQLSVAIVVGGRASRFNGGCKPLEQLGGRAIIDWQLKAFSPLCQTIALVAKSADDIDVELAKRIGPSLEFAADAASDVGPLAGIAGALDWSPTPWVFVVAGDMPFVGASLIEQLTSVRDQQELSAQLDAVAPSAGGRVQPLAALYHKRCGPILHKLIDQRLLSPTKLFSKPGLLTKTVPLPENREHQIRGFNTQAELAALEQLYDSQPRE